ncbi:MAG: MerR family transcriptional regulator [Chloroflexota bacterium]|nr:MAG: MerR family transcriptional regulator [Chloroflexota bacterium]
MTNETIAAAADPAGSEAAAAEDATPRLLKIAEVAEELGLTARAVRYYEELGLLKPAARSEGSYRLFDDDDIERLRFIRGLRDDAGFSLAEIGRLLEDEEARERNREQFRATTDVAERRQILRDALDRVERQATSLRGKLDRITAMLDEVEARRVHLERHLGELDAGRALSHRETGS